MKSRVISLSINFSMIALPFTVRRIVALAFLEECVVTWCSASGFGSPDKARVTSNVKVGGGGLDICDAAFSMGAAAF
jgi:hypothetical protein